MKSNTLILTATIATAIYAQNLPQEESSEKWVPLPGNRGIYAVVGYGTISGLSKRQENATSGADLKKAEEEEAEGGESEEQQEEEENESVSSFIFVFWNVPEYITLESIAGG